MASERQKARDARARERGYKNAYDERNQKAKRQGYKNYNEQRKARRTGIGLKGDDKPKVSPVGPRNVPPPPPRLAPRRQDPPREAPRVSPSGEHIANPLNSSFRHTASVTKAEVLEATEFGLKKERAGISPRARKHREVVQNFQGRVKQDVEAVRRTYSGSLGQHYLDAYRKGLGDPNASLDQDALKAYTKIFQNGTRDAERAAVGATRSLKGTLEDMEDLSLRSRRKAARRDSLKGAVFSNGARWDYNTFLEMSTNANVARASNDGFIRGAVKAGVKFFEIIDGDDCGLTSHDALPKAAGMVVDADTALSYPIAHPNCIRQFIARPDVKDDPDRVKNALKKAVKSYASDVLRQSAQATLANSLQAFLKNNNVQDRVVAWASSHGAQWPFVFRTAAQATGHSPAENIRDMTTYIDDYMEGKAVPSRVVGMLGLDEVAPARAVGDEMGRWDNWYDRTVRAKLMGLSTEVDGLIHDPNVRNAVFNQFFDAVGGLPVNPGNFVRWSLPKIKGKTTGVIERPRLTLVGKDSVKATITRTDKGFVNHIRLNPNGLIRAGVSQIEGSFIPTLSLIPKGPIRVMTRVNRGVKGNITSLSTEVRLITPKWAIRTMNDVLGLTENGEAVDWLGGIGINFSTSLNLNLRQLGLRNLRDVTKLTLDDWKELRQATYYDPIKGVIDTHPVVRVASLAAEVRLLGGTLSGLAHTFRVPWQDVRAFWSLGNLELQMVENIAKLEKILDRRNKNRITDINEVVHPYTLAESRARRGGISLIKSDLEPLSPLPDEAPKPKKPDLKGTKIEDLNLGTVGDQDNQGTVLLVPTDWNERMLITKPKPGSTIPKARPVQTLDELWEWLAATRGSYLADRDFEQQKSYMKRFFRRGLWYNMPEELRRQIKETYDIDVHVQGDFPEFGSAISRQSYQDVKDFLTEKQFKERLKNSDLRLRASILRERAVEKLRRAATTARTKGKRGGDTAATETIDKILEELPGDVAKQRFEEENKNLLQLLRLTEDELRGPEGRKSIWESHDPDITDNPRFTFSLSDRLTEDDVELLGNVDPTFYDDAASVANFMEKRFPSAPRLEYVIDGSIKEERGWSGAYSPLQWMEESLRKELPGVQGVLKLSLQDALSWSTDNYVRTLKNGLMDWAPRGVTQRHSTIVHEWGHHLDLLLKGEEREELYRKLADGLWGETGKLDSNRRRFPRPDHEVVKDLLVNPELSEMARKKVSDYAVADGIPEELVAEAFAEYILSPNPRPIARMVGKFLEEKWGPNRKPDLGRFPIAMGPGQG